MWQRVRKQRLTSIEKDDCFFRRTIVIKLPLKEMLFWWLVTFELILVIQNIRGDQKIKGTNRSYVKSLKTSILSPVEISIEYLNISSGGVIS